MRVRLSNRGTRNQLTCLRDDGSFASSEIGPRLPHHDLAHLVVERAFELDDGFFANIAHGYTPAELSDPQVIRRLGTAPYRAEILARALESLDSGACRPDQYEMLVNEELAALSLSPMPIPVATVSAIAAEYRDLLARFAGLPDGGSLELSFDVSSKSAA